jgi:hypothetical protein
VKNLAHSACLQADEKTAPPNLGIKRLTLKKIPTMLCFTIDQKPPMVGLMASPLAAASGPNG